MTNNEINVTATCIAALANQPNSEEKIKLLLTSLFCSYEKEGYLTEPKNDSEPSVSSMIIFTQKEISKMPKTFKKEFIANGLSAHVLKRKKRKNAISFEIRYRRNGYNIHVTASTIDAAKAKFISATLPENIEIFDIIVCDYATEKQVRKLLPKDKYDEEMYGLRKNLLLTFFVKKEILNKIISE